MICMKDTSAPEAGTASMAASVEDVVRLGVEMLLQWNMRIDKKINYYK